MSEFTKGEWKINSIKLADYENHAIHNGKEVIAHLYNNGNQLVNAKLIAHAPQMLELLKDFVNTANEDCALNIDYYKVKFEQLIQQATTI